MSSSVGSSTDGGCSRNLTMAWPLCGCRNIICSGSAAWTARISSSTDSVTPFRNNASGFMCPSARPNYCIYRRFPSPPRRSSRTPPGQPAPPPPPRVPPPPHQLPGFPYAPLLEVESHEVLQQLVCGRMPPTQALHHDL